MMDTVNQDAGSRDVTPQPAPVRNQHPAVWDAVVEDIRARDAAGEKKYGVRLQPFNGREAVVDAYQEALDLAVYLKQAILERQGGGDGEQEYFERCVRDLMAAFGQEAPEKQTVPAEEVRQLRVDLIEEEAREFREASERGDIVEVADAIADLIVVVVGAAVTWGIPLKACFDEVHRSNMSKVGEDGKVVRREDGKVLKPEGWSRPDLERVLREAGRR